MKNRKKITVLSALLIFSLLCGCAAPAGAETPAASTAGADEASSTEIHAADAEQYRTAITDAFTLLTENGSFTEQNGVYTITAAGDYVLSGLLTEGCICVAAPTDAEVCLELQNASITCSTAAPIQVLSAKDVRLKVPAGSFSEICDARTEASAEDDSGKAAIFSRSDLSLSGKGALVVSSGIGQGIRCKEQLNIKNLTLRVQAAETALRGDEGVTVESGQLLLISSQADGIKTTDSNLSAKGNQKGNVDLQGGTLEIYSCCDGIDAACSVTLSGEVQLSAVTGTYSEYSGTAQSTRSLYLVLPASLYSTQKSYYAYFYSSSDPLSGSWAKAEFFSTISGGWTQYYGLKLDTAPSDSVVFVACDLGTQPDAASLPTDAGQSVNNSMNAFVASELTDGVFTGDWANLQTGSGSSRGTTWSSKGIKAESEIRISGGTVSLSCSDDGIHANGLNATLDSGEAAAGRVDISGGSLSIRCDDDGIHADGELCISGGTLTITEAYEGLEANRITISGGELDLYAEDDGINACSGDSTPLVQVSGGRVQVRTPSGDTDGIDSNGSYEQTGGVMLVLGGSSTGSMAGSVDVDGSIRVTGGTIVAFGGICEVPEDGCNGYAMSSQSFSAGSYTLLCGGETLLQFELPAEYRGVWLCSESFAEGLSCSLRCDGSSVLSWNQEAGICGEYSSGGFGSPGGFGGGFGGRGPGR